MRSGCNSPAHYPEISAHLKVSSCHSCVQQGASDRNQSTCQLSNTIYCTAAWTLLPKNKKQQTKKQKTLLWEGLSASPWDKPPGTSTPSAPQEIGDLLLQLIDYYNKQQLRKPLHRSYSQPRNFGSLKAPRDEAKWSQTTYTTVIPLRRKKE